MHIGKTAGSYINDILIRSLGPERCLTHAEAYIEDNSNFKKLIADKAFVSGHIYYRSWLNLVDEVRREFLTATLVREPSSHLKSHLLWLDHLTLPQYEQVYLACDVQVRQVIDLVGRTNLGSAESISSLFSVLPPKGIELLNNCQSRYFLFSKHSRDLSKELDASYRAEITAVLRQFDILGTNRHIIKFLTRVEEVLEVRLQIHSDVINPARSPRGIDLNDDRIQKVIETNSSLDRFLYRSVLSLCETSPVNRAKNFVANLLT